jgi:hypothetical protein
MPDEDVFNNLEVSKRGSKCQFICIYLKNECSFGIKKN